MVAVIVMAVIFVIIAAIVAPMIVIPVVVAVADEFLAVAFAAELGIHSSVIGVMEIGPRFVDHHFVTVIKVEVAVTRGQVVREDPTAAALINELMVGHIVVGLDVRDVVIVDMVVTRRTPGGLTADVDGNTDLSMGGVGEGDAAKNGACQEEIFHTF
jgi:hypothetical protein